MRFKPRPGSRLSPRLRGEIQRGALQLATKQQKNLGPAFAGMSGF